MGRGSGFGPEMVSASREDTGPFRSLTRFHFICGLPRSGRGVLAALLQQNPRFRVVLDGPAQAVLAATLERLGGGGIEAGLLDPAQKAALGRAVLDALHHDRAPGATVFDANRDWLLLLDDLVRLYPLCRFIICVRNPAAIVNSHMLAAGGGKSGEDLEDTAAALSAPDGSLGAGLEMLRAALSSPHAERMFVLDYDRLADDPEEVMDVLCDFLREPTFAHDPAEIGGAGFPGISGPVRRAENPMLLPTRLVLQLSGRAFWRNLKRTGATLMLGRAR